MKARASDPDSDPTPPPDDRAIEAPDVDAGRITTPV